MGKESIIMDQQAITRTLMRISHEIIEQNHDLEKVLLVGIITRGTVLAKRIQQNIEKVLQVTVPLGILDITLHRDDLDTIARSQIKTSDIPVDITDMNIVLLDDVLFSGRTVRAALDELIDFGRPQRIQLAVLIDRGHREFPIRADFVGKNVPTNVSQTVKVHLQETDKTENVIIIEE